MPIVGSFAGASARAYGASAGDVGIGDFESIQTITVGSAVGSIEFTSIPQTYSHLQIRVLARSADAAAAAFGYINFNTALFGGGVSCHSHKVLGDGSTVTASALNGTSYMQLGDGIGNTSTANAFGAIIIDILEYTNTNKKKPFRALFGWDSNGAGKVGLSSGFYDNTAAITSIVFTFDVGMTQYSSATLYGIKA